MIVLYVVLVVIGLCVVYTRRSKGNRLPGPRGLPFIGSALEINESNIVAKFEELAEQYGDVFAVNMFGTTVMSVNTASATREILTSEDYKRHTNDRPPTFVGDYVYPGSNSIGFTQNGFSDLHGNLRKGLVKGLHVYGQEGLRHFEHNVLKQLNAMQKRFEDMEGEDIEIVSLVRRSITNTISIAISGEALNDDDPDIDAFWDFVDGMNYFLRAAINNLMLTFPFLRFIPGVPRAKYKQIMAARDKLHQRYVVQQKATRVAGEPRGLVDVLLEEQDRDIQAGRQPTFTDERIINVLLDTITAGILTTWSALTATILCLANHPEYQDKLYMELIDNIGTEKDATHSDKYNCPWFEAIEMEVHRLCTAVPVILPHVNNVHLKYQDYDVPKNTIIYGNLWHIHHSADIWQDPWKFRPERFLDEDGQLLPKDHVLRRNWMAFGVGKRSCIGEPFARSRYFLYIATLIRKWKFVPSPGRCAPCDPRQQEYFTSDATIRVKSFHCKVEKRQCVS